ncbi:hypothetical protein RADP37_03170a (plasmid) [Roseomonas mucosa]|uniref:Uncharacterized protein n=1 Tax=Roseomonas mucosa TaxID=207340 RepID=A0A4Y1MRB7_9PROT|nr:hypothetical protein RADP37_03170a [Roseomonas mucosa]
MHKELFGGESRDQTSVSTGHLPPPERVDELLEEAHHRFRSNDDGVVAVSIGTELGPQIGTQKGPSCEVC